MTSVQLRLSPDAPAWSEVGDLTVLLDLHEQHYYLVNDTGALLWRLLSLGTTLDDMTAHLCAAYAIDRVQADTDVATFVTECRARGYLER